jgi:lipopolysaccharide/colanic/teichoic acid biosynthesis glycosyltransferase
VEKTPPMSALSAQHIYARALYVGAPALTAAAMVLFRGSAGEALAVLLSFVATSLLLWPERMPMRLMPIASNALRLFAPVAGTALVLAPGILSAEWPVDPADMTGPLVGALLIVVLARFLERRFDTGAPVRLAVIGSRQLAAKLSDELRANKISGYQVIGYITADTAEPEPQDEEDIPWLGELDDVRAAVLEHRIHLLGVGPDTPRLAVFEEAARACLDLPVRMIEANALYEQVLGHVPIGSINSAWFQCIMHPNYSPSAPGAKRALDLAVGLAAVLLLALPLLPLIALMIKLEDRGPLFFRQRRVGEQGREFDMVKFRTMTPDADERRAAGVPEEELITRTGRLLRLTHLNELPQLWNVLRGDMTIVGPRPEPPELVRALGNVVPYYERRALVKPGLTGWAQVRCGYAGDQVGTAWKMCHDLFYVKHRSVAFDVLIMLQTLHVLVETSEEEFERPHEEFILGEVSGLAGR